MGCPVTERLQLAVLLDWQNVHGCGREAFPNFPPPANLDPLKIARYLVRDRPTNPALATDLVSVSVFFGVASPERDPKTHGARQRQMQHWQGLSARVKTFPRPLKYGKDGPVEKGIDVTIAIELVRSTVFAPNCDVAVLFSSDTDLLPALELVAANVGAEKVEVAAWQGGSPPLRIGGGFRIRQHVLPESVYRACLDPRDYNVSA